MRKDTYYVCVDMGTLAGEIRTEKLNNSSFHEYEIRATPEEIDRLGMLFEKLQDADWKQFTRAHVPNLDTEIGEELQSDQWLDRIYRMIHQLGTEETRRQLEETGLVKGRDR
ncbi:hypothetical protein [Staphylospora marina]|uniref:hypothetical protein n=1 Tax=Staphylospora marina TaxID=2490858 RepID=UPI000F5BCE97|nr:hypothetical protein [Staphylospora marina]